MVRWNALPGTPCANKREKPALESVVADWMEPLLRRADADRLGPAVVAGRMEQVEGVDARKMEQMEQVVGKRERMLVAGTREQLGPVAVVDKKLELMETVAGTMEYLLGPAAAGRLEELLQGLAVAGTMEQIEEVDARKMEPMLEQVVGKKKWP